MLIIGHSKRPHFLAPEFQAPWDHGDTQQPHKELSHLLCTQQFLQRLVEELKQLLGKVPPVCEHTVKWSSPDLPSLGPGSFHHV